MYNFIHGLMHNYSQFSLHNMMSVIDSPSDWAKIAILIFMEGILSIDNALTLAMMVKPLPEKMRKKALMYGMGGAYLFRFIAIGVGTFLIKITFVKVLGAVYLLWMAYKGLFGGPEEENKVKLVKGFWHTVLMVEFMDIAFSIDSVTAAFGVSDEVWVLFLGAIFGILMMRGVSQVFVILLDKIPELEKSAYILIAIVGVKMLLGIVHVEIPEWAFITLMFGTLGLTFIKHGYSKTKAENLAKLKAGKVDEIV